MVIELLSVLVRSGGGECRDSLEMGHERTLFGVRNVLSSDRNGNS